MKKIVQVAMAGVRIAAVAFLIYCIVFGLIGGEESSPVDTVSQEQDLVLSSSA